MRTSAVLRRMALNMLKRETTSQGGLAAKRKRAGWDEDYLLLVLAHQNAIALPLARHGNRSLTLVKAVVIITSALLYSFLPRVTRPSIE